MGDLTEHFNRAEFACKCGCGADHISPTLAARLEIMRAMLGSKITITSGVRCPAHNKVVGGVENSEHLSGEAADILCDNAIDRYRMVEIAMLANIERIGIGKGFIHCGIKLQHPHTAIWLYT